MKKWITLLLVAVMLCSLTVAAPAEEKLSFSFSGYNNVGDTIEVDENGHNWFTQFMNDRYGVDITYVPCDTQDWDKMVLFWSTEGYVDVFISMGNVLRQRAAYVDDDVIRSFPKEWLKEYCPTLWNMCLTALGDENAVWDQLLLNDQLYTVPFLNTAVLCPYSMTAIRNDWLDKVGLDAPVTLEDWHEMLTAFTFNDPDGNGIDDTYGMSIAWQGVNACLPLSAYFGVSDLCNYRLGDDGAVTMTNTTENYRAYLSTLAKWYEEGIIDPEFRTDGRTQWREKFSSSQRLGIYSDHYQQMCVVEGWAYKAIPALNDAGFTYLCAIEDQNGQMTYNAQSGSLLDSYNWFFGYDCPDDVIIFFLKTYEEILNDTELRNTLWYGDKGVNWDYDANGQVAVLTAGQDEPAGKYTFYVANVLTEETCHTWRAVVYPERSRELFALIDNDFARNAYTNNFLMPSLDDISKDAKTAIESLVSSFYFEAIGGDIDIDDDAVWEGYLKELENLGMKDLLSAIQAAL